MLRLSPVHVCLCPDVLHLMLRTHCLAEEAPGLSNTGDGVAEFD